MKINATPLKFNHNIYNLTIILLVMRSNIPLRNIITYLIWIFVTPFLYGLLIKSTN